MTGRVDTWNAGVYEPAHRIGILCAEDVYAHITCKQFEWIVQSCTRTALLVAQPTAYGWTRVDRTWTRSGLCAMWHCWLEVLLLYISVWQLSSPCSSGAWPFATCPLLLVHAVGTSLCLKWSNGSVFIGCGYPSANECFPCCVLKHWL